MNIIIIEDEPLAAEKLKNLLSEVLPDACVIGVFDSIALTVKWFQQKQNSADLIFMDIHLADGLCFSIFEQVNILSPVIFTTAYDEYALKAFKFNSIDYLLKPISESALKYSIQQYATLKEIWKTPIIDYSLLSAAISGNKKTYKQRFLVKMVISLLVFRLMMYTYSMQKKNMSFSSYHQAKSLSSTLRLISWKNY